nr:SDR family oxidoreductase [Auraticoccus cholistanensis]
MITGGGHGIGRACAHRLADEGARVVLADVDLEAAEKVVAELVEKDVEATAVGCDVTDTASVDAAVAQAVERLGGLDVLVHTVGGGLGHPDFLRTSDDDWHQQLELNLMGVVRSLRAALPHLVQTRGNAVMIGSVNGMVSVGSEPYSAAKAGLQNMTHNLAAEYGPHGVRINLVAPGTIRTRVWDHQPDRMERLAQSYPLGRIGEPEDIAAAVAYLASDDASWVTGISLPVEGGALAAGPYAWRG